MGGEIGEITTCFVCLELRGGKRKKREILTSLHPKSPENWKRRERENVLKGLKLPQYPFQSSGLNMGERRKEGIEEREGSRLAHVTERGEEKKEKNEVTKEFLILLHCFTEGEGGKKRRKKTTIRKGTKEVNIRVSRQAYLPLAEATQRKRGRGRREEERRRGGKRTDAFDVVVLAA